MPDAWEDFIDESRSLGDLACGLVWFLFHPGFGAEDEPDPRASSRRSLFPLPNMWCSELRRIKECASAPEAMKAGQKISSLQISAGAFIYPHGS